jgi:SagB-type dehydrogenase family enzyme
MFMEKKIVAVIVAIAILAGLAAVYMGWLRPDEKVFPAFGVVELPDPQTTGPMSVEEAILRRRSIRSYTDEPLSMQDISQLLWSAQGITDPGRRRFRAAPSAGATYPLEVYVVVGTGGVIGLDEGLYRYDPFEHRLENRLRGDLRSSLADAAWGQGWVRNAPINIVIAAVYERTTGRYGDRGIRYVHMEVGHVGQNLYLQAEARGLGTVVVGAFRDNQVRDLLQLPVDQRPLYIVPIGHPVS